MTEPNRIHTVLTLSKRARLRRFVRIFLATAGRSLLGGSAIAIALACAEMLIGLPIDWWAAFILIGVLVVLGSLAAALTRTGTLLDAAREVDASLGLDDRISSALDLSQNKSPDAFVDLATIEGERAAGETSARQAIAFKLGKTWAAWPALAALAIAIGLYAPRYDLLGGRALEQIAFERETEQARATEQIRQVRDELKEELSAGTLETEDPASEQALRTLDALERELDMGTESSDSAREKAAGALNEAAREFEDRADTADTRRRATEEILSELARDPAPSEADGNQTGTEADASEFDATDALRESLSKSDLDEAVKALDEIQRQLEQLTPEQREALERELEALADELRDAGERAKEDIAQDREIERKELNDWGVDERDAAELQHERTEEEIREELEELGFDEDKARRMAQNIAEKERERRAREQAAEDTEQLAQDIDRAAQDVNETPETEQPDKQNKDEQQPSNDPDDPQNNSADEPRDSENGQQETDQQKQPSQETPEPDEQQQESDRKGKDAPEGDASEKSDRPNAEKPGKQGEQQQQQQGTEPGKPDGAQKSPSDSQQPGQENQQPGTDGDSQEQMPGGNGGDPDAKGELDSLRERIDEMRKNSSDAERLRGNAGKLREQAKNLLEDMSPAERERLADWLRSEQAERGNAQPFDTEDLDARAASDSKRVTDERTNPSWQPGSTDGSVSERALPDELREAARGNERALEERSVPAKYRNVEEYFRRAIERAEKDAAKTKPPAPIKQAEDAKSDG